MKKFLLVAFLFFGSQEVFAAGGAPCGDYGECDSFKPELNNMESLQLGALTFINHCYGCHSLKYSRWGRIAKDLDIPEDIFNDNLVFGANSSFDNSFSVENKSIPVYLILFPCMLFKRAHTFRDVTP